ncbi:MAG: hypothetical protein ACHP84_06465 [Caulobacterales bacterium]
MQTEVITHRDDLLIRRAVLAPGEATAWHIDLTHRFTVVVRGDRLAIEFRDGGERQEIAIHPGLADWDAPDLRPHRAINMGAETFEEVVMFFLQAGERDPQPRSR